MEKEEGVAQELWYRYSDPWTAGEPPCLQSIPVERHTNRCVVLDDYGYRRFVLKDARKRYAYPTVELALESYIVRKKRQIKHAASTHDNAKANLAVAEAISRGEAAPRRSTFVVDAFDEVV